MEIQEINIKKSRGRPKKVLTSEEMAAVLNKPKLPRGRPHKVLSAEEVLALQNLTKRPRGRPKKEIDAEVVNSQEVRQRGRPHKILTPQEEWVSKYAPKKESRGRPQKNQVLSMALPQILTTSVNDENYVAINLPAALAVPNLATAKDEMQMENSTLALEDTDLELVDVGVMNVKEQQPINQTQGTVEIEKKAPVLSWEELKEKIALSEFNDNYIFPWSEEGSNLAKAVKEEKTITAKPVSGLRKVLVRDAREPSAYVLDLKKNLPKIITTTNADSGLDEVEYLWDSQAKIKNQSNIAGVLNFELPNDVMTKVHMKELEENVRHSKKAKNLKVDFTNDFLNSTQSSVIKNVPSYGIRNKTGFFDTALTVFGKLLYKIWRILTAPFRFLDFVVDSILKGIWLVIKFIFIQTTKLLRLNLFYVKKVFSYLIDSISVIFRNRQTVRQLAVNTDASEVVIRTNRFNFKPILSFLVLAVVLVVPFGAWHLYQESKTVQGSVLGASLQGVDYFKSAAKTLSQQDMAQALQQFKKAETSFKLAQTEIDGLGVLNSWLVNLIPQVKNGGNLLRAGELAAGIGQELTRGLAIFNKTTIDASAKTEICDSLPDAMEKCTNINDLDLTSRINYFKNILDQEEVNFNELTEILAKTDINELPEDKQAEMLVIKDNVGIIKKGYDELRQLLGFSLNFLGAEKTKRYLVIFQNSNELRPTGGFMGSFAVVDIARGKVKKIDVPGGGLYDLKGSSQTNVAAPKPLQLFSPAWQIWNANWFPDWPTSAAKIVWFYENNAGGSSVDGVISLTQDVVTELLKNTGPLEMKDYSKTLTVDNFTQEVQTAVEIEYDKEENKPKQIIADMTPILLQRLISADGQDYFKNILSLSQALTEKKFLLYFIDPLEQAVVDRFNWSGRLQEITSEQDYLMIVHTNISGGKADGVIKNKIKHTAEIQADGSIIDTISLTRSHQGSPEKMFEKDNNVDYVRFYVPKGAKLISTSGFNFNPDYLFTAATDNLIPDKTLAEVEKDVSIDEASHTRISQEFNKTVFGNWIQVAPGQSRVVEIKYLLPFRMTFKNNQSRIASWVSAILNKKEQFKYTFLADKQLGMNEIDFNSQLVLPSDFSIQDTMTSDELKVNNQQVMFSTNLTTNGYYGVVIEK